MASRPRALLNLSPEGGVKGGEIVARSMPEQVVLKPQSFMGKYLAPLLGKGSAKAKDLQKRIRLFV